MRGISTVASEHTPQIKAALDAANQLAGGASGSDPAIPGQASTQSPRGRVEGAGEMTSLDTSDLDRKVWNWSYPPYNRNTNHIAKILGMKEYEVEKILHRLRDEK